MTHDPTDSIREWLARFAGETGETITHLCDHRPIQAGGR